MSLNIDYHRLDDMDHQTVQTVTRTGLFLNKSAPSTKSKKREFKLIIVDDDQEDILYLSELLVEVFGEHVDFHIEASSSFLDAEAKLSTEHYDLAIFDFRLGYQDGLELYARVKKTNPKLPVIFVTGQGDERVAVAALKQGAVDYLVKDKLSQELVEQVFKPYMKVGERRLAESMRAVISKSKESDESKFSIGLGQLSMYQPKQVFVRSQAYKNRGGDLHFFQTLDSLIKEPSL